MAPSMDMGLLPMIKCSNCGMSVEISAMGDHVCAKIESAPPHSPPRPPSKSSIGSPPKAGNAWAARAGRMNPPPRIDPSVANRPFLHPRSPMDNKDLLVPSPLSTATSGGARSPLRPTPQRSQTSPLPREPQSPDSINMETAFASFPLPRSMSDRRPTAISDSIAAGKVPPLPSTRHASSLSRDGHNAPVELPADNEVPPPPLPKDGPPLPGVSHRYGTSIDSKSSYRTSVASTRYSDHRTSKRSTSISIRHPSFGSVSREHLKYIDEEAPPVPAPAPQNLLLPGRLSGAEIAEKPEGRGEIYSGFDFGMSNRPTSAKAELDHVAPASLRVSSHTSRSSGRLSSNRGSAELFFQSPTPSPNEAPVDFEFPDEPAVSPAAPANVEYKAFKVESSEVPQPTDAENLPIPGQDEMQREDFDAASESNTSTSNFARALGLDVPDPAADSSITSSDSSPSDTRSGTSLSSLPSEASLSRRQPSDPSRLDSVVEELKGARRPKEPVLDEPVMESPIDLEPPRITEHLFSPDSPTDPAISQGSLSLVSEKLPRKPDSHQPERPTMLRSTTAPAPAPRPSPRPKGPCRGCGEMIVGKSVSSADGRLTGRYHRACFVCFQCKTPFETADFYVLEDRPFCAQHYHERNGSLCATCHTGIEGQYLETEERRGRGPGDRRKFHPNCLKCRTCGIALNGDYFEWYGQVYCERDARQAAAATMPPPRTPRSPMPMSPMGPPPGRGYPPPPGYGGRGRGRPPPGPRPGSSASQAPPVPMLRPPGPGDGPYGAIGALPNSRRFPERRTTKLMMI
ncbi:LIM domain-containing protein [Aspergillus saccharolyticus JOP 1030-1]|uniref:LIM zinc-binding domain-containing protein n=1 Tax=Aspergillus saccharolyticus JOP 1030-1 TaxID=1450539 RepID=A0A318Z2I0_9EURO|nr:hypothetical protein BP01DRAFT_395205 [Aspergillus saccharolyticus JOP 1030-1]PYH41266.1 hypothetical protein BP01DRAFT_395205 [Aspergillus saccharolyticus JOP 1030-1]